MALLISLEFFSPDLKGLPPLEFDPVVTSETEQCSCVDAVDCHLGPLGWPVKYRLRILSKSTSTLTKVVSTYNDHLLDFNSGESHQVAQRALLQNLAKLCDCLGDFMERIRISRRNAAQAQKSKQNTSLALDLFHKPASVQKLELLSGSSEVRDTINQALRERIGTPLRRHSGKGNELKPGFVYVMESASLPGFVVVGHSDRNPSFWPQSVQEYISDMDLVYSTETQVPHDARIEGLAHLEMGLQRRTYKGCSDATKVELFKISSHLALQIVLRWVDWATSKPYEGENGMFSLKTVWRQKLAKKLDWSTVPATENHLTTERTRFPWEDDPEDVKDENSNEGKMVVRKEMLSLFGTCASAACCACCWNGCSSKSLFS